MILQSDLENVRIAIYAIVFANTCLTEAFQEIPRCKENMILM